MSNVTAQLIPDSVDMDWVRDKLLAYATVCEAKLCPLQAVGAHVGRKQVVYLCDLHLGLVEQRPHIGRAFERDMWAWFNDMFNFIVLVESTHGELLADIEARQAEVRVAEKADETAAERAEREFHAELKKHHRELLKTVRIGAPDDGLMEARGVQSPSRDTQPVLRLTEPTLVAPVVLPQHPRADTLIFVSPIQGWK